MFGVFDGHGEEGQSVSGYIKSQLPKHICSYLSNKASKITDALWKSIKKIDSEIKKTEIDWVNSKTNIELN